MSAKGIQRLLVPFGGVDRENVLTLHGVFNLLQEAAIAHASQFDSGTEAMVTRGESWILKRMAVAVDRYPRYAEPLRVETWSSGIRAFKGYREFRVFASADGRDELVIRGSSVWVYVSMRSRRIIPVPADVAARFLAADGGVFCPDLEDLELEAPDPAAAESVPVTLRYSDVDANHHVNNAAYLDLLQTALARLGRPVRPAGVRLKYGKGIPSDTEGVEVRPGPRADHGPTLFSIGSGASTYAQGDLAWPA